MPSKPSARELTANAEGFSKAPGLSQINMSFQIRKKKKKKVFWLTILHIL